MADRFLKLRGLLSAPPSSRVWFRLCRLLGHWSRDDSQLDMAVTYATSHLASWTPEQQELFFYFREYTP